MARDGGDRRRCHVCWERGHISLDCPVRQGLLHLANMAAELNNRIRRPVPIRVYRVNTHRRRVRPRRRRGRQRQEHASERNHTGPHELPPRPAHVSPELNYGDCGPYHRDVQDLPLRPPAGDKDKENIRPAPFANPAHSQAGAAYDRHDVNMRFDSSTANHLISSSGLAAGTKMESGTPVEHVDNSASVYVQASGAVDVQITRSDTFATSNESGTHENLPSLSFNVSGDMVMTEESQAVADDYCNTSTPIVINQDTRAEDIQTLDEGMLKVYANFSQMESMPPDAFDSHPTSPYAGQLHSAGNPDIESINGVAATTVPSVKVDDPPKFELESYIANYTGRTKFNRLFLIGTCSTYLSVEALKAAIVEAKSSKDVSRYERAVRALADSAPYEAEATPDNEWIDRTRKVVKAETDRLEHELRGYKNNLIKESIRMGNEDLGQHYHQIGDLVSASKAYSRMRDYCTTPSHIASMLFKIINVAIERGDWLSVQSHVQRLRNLQSKQEEQAKNQPKMSAAMGLSQLHSGAYLEAANSFLSTDPTLGDSYNEVLTSNDVAVYGGLCALASMDRNELQRRVLDNSSFRNFLELEPHIRRAISFFCNSKFRLCLDILESYQTDYLLDVHLQRHVSTLYTRIRTKSIQQYLVPFSRVTLDSMSKIFAPAATSGQAQPIHSKSPFVQELIGLIQDGTLDSRIDLEKMVLVSNQTDKRTEVQEAVLESLSSYIDEAHIRLLRTNIIRAGLEVRPLGDERKQGHAGPGPKHSRPPTGVFQ